MTAVLAQSDTERARMEYERQQREYWRAQEAKRMEDQRQQQIYDEQRRRDEEASKKAFKLGESPSPSGGAQVPGTASMGGASLQQDAREMPSAERCATGC